MDGIECFGIEMSASMPRENRDVEWDAKHCSYTREAGKVNYPSDGLNVLGLPVVDYTFY